MPFLSCVVKLHTFIFSNHLILHALNYTYNFAAPTPILRRKLEILGGTPCENTGNSGDPIELWGSHGTILYVSGRVSIISKPTDCSSAHNNIAKYFCHKNILTFSFKLHVLILTYKRPWVQTASSWSSPHSEATPSCWIAPYEQPKDTLQTCEDGFGLLLTQDSK